MEEKINSEILEVLDNQKNILDSDPGLEYELNNSYIKQLKEEYPTIYNGYKQIINEQFELFSKKHLDYGMSNISAGTQLSNQDEKEFALTGLWYRISDKVNRWKNIMISRRKTNNETMIDTYQDLVNYGIIAQLVERGLWKK